MKKNLLRLMPLMLLGVWLGSGCIPPLYYKDMVAAAPFEGGDAVTVAVQDRREYITSGKTEDSYEGQVRATVGIPYHRNTVTGGPLAAEMARGLAATLTTKGYQVTVIGTAPADAPEEIAAKLAGSKPSRSLYLVINEWMYDGWGSYKLESKLTLKVMDGQGKLLAATEHTLEENLGSHPENPAKEAFRRRLEALLSNPDVAKAMASGSTTAAPPADPDVKPGETMPADEEPAADPDVKPDETQPAEEEPAADPDKKEVDANKGTDPGVKEPAEATDAKNRTEAPPATK